MAPRIEGVYGYMNDVTLCNSACADNGKAAA
jgi:hypothetical protein